MDKLYETVNEMMARLGADGTISTDAQEVDAVMSALYDIDGGSASQPNVQADAVCHFCGKKLDDSFHRCDDCRYAG